MKVMVFLRPFPSLLGRIVHFCLIFSKASLLHDQAAFSEDRLVLPSWQHEMESFQSLHSNNGSRSLLSL